MNNCQEHEFVDLGLPSGTLWATCNVGASKPEDYGDYFAWGETKTKDVYYWDTYKHATRNYGKLKLTKYCDRSDCGSNGFTDTLTELQPIDDPATANWGNGWYTPKNEQWDELEAHTNREWTTRNGVKGWLFISRRNGKSLFLPAAGYRWGGDLDNAGNCGDYWSSSLCTDGPFHVWNFFSDSNGILLFDNDRSAGHTVRAVRSAQLDMNCCPEHKYVDLGLPSGTLWATCNIGANQPEDYGDYFSWNVGITAAAKRGTGWRMPSKGQWEELKENTKSTWTTRNGVNGRLFISNNGNSLFLPAAGRWNGELNDAGSYGLYWSSSLCTGNPNFAWRFYFNSGDYDLDNYYRRGSGLSVRAVRSAHQN